MIVSFRSKALEPFWWKGEVRWINSRHVEKIERILMDLEAAIDPSDMVQPACRRHRLAGKLRGRYSVRVDKNWRIAIPWSDTDTDAVDVDYEDYH